MTAILPIFSANINGFQEELSNNDISSFINENLYNYEWAVTFGGSNIDVGHYVEQTNDGGYIITGYTRSYGTTSGRNVWLIKTDASGNELWNNTYGGSNDEEGWCVQQTTDGGYIITGYTKSFGAQLEDVLLIKTDSQGNQQWLKTFGGSNNDGGRSVRQTPDGGYIIAGYTSSFGAGSVDAYLIKTDASGNIEWTKTHGGSSTDGAYCIQLTSDGGFILTGWTMSYGPGYLLNAWLVKTDDMGNQQWHQAFGGTDVDKAYSVLETFDGGYVITGETDSFGAGLYDMFLIKTDSAGNQQWMKTFGGTQRDYGYSVAQTFNGNFILTGYTRSYGAGGDDVWVVKTDSAGNEVWNETYGGSSSDVGYSIKQTNDGGYIVVGHTLSYGAGLHDVWLVKLESDETPPPLEVDAGGPYEGIIGEPINFTGTVTGGIPPYDFHWDFGDSQTSNQQSPTHTYNTVGVYTALFTVTDNQGTQANDTATVTITSDDTTPPKVTITKPLAKTLYLFNTRLVRFPITLIIGTIDVTAEAIDNQSGINYVILTLNGEIKLNLTEPPYIWKWDERFFGRYTIAVEAVDNAGNKATDEIDVVRLF
ncbi:MAG: PKD domain-containing protein [Thermoplasmatota archaeon]